MQQGYNLKAADQCILNTLQLKDTLLSVTGDGTTKYTFLQKCTHI